MAAISKSVLLDIVKALEQAALKAIILGEGPLANLFGTAPAAGATGTGAIGGIFGQLLNAGGGGLGGLFGGLFSGKFAEGGAIPSGRFGLVGEAGAGAHQWPRDDHALQADQCGVELRRRAGW